MFGVRVRTIVVLAVFGIALTALAIAVLIALVLAPRPDLSTTTLGLAALVIAALAAASVAPAYLVLSAARRLALPDDRLDSFSFQHEGIRRRASLALALESIILLVSVSVLTTIA